MDVLQFFSLWKFYANFWFGWKDKSVFHSKNWVGWSDGWQLCFLEISQLSFTYSLLHLGLQQCKCLFSLLYCDNFSVFRWFSNSNFLNEATTFIKLKCKHICSFICHLHPGLPSQFRQ